MKTLYMMIGLPGCGKSTEIRRMTDKIGYEHTVLSTDKFIESYAHTVGKDYNEVFKETIPFAEKNLENELKVAIEAGRDIFWDQTNLSKKARAKKLAKIPADYKKIAVVIKTDGVKLQEQLDKRVREGGKYIAQEVVDSMRKTFEEPSHDEGFQEIIWR